MANLPDDILRNVFSSLPQETLVQCRFLNRPVEPLARALAFRCIRLEAGCDVDPFIQVVRSERLRPLVREATLELLQSGPTRGATPYGFRLQHDRQILDALPLVRLLSGLRKLNVRFGRLQHHGDVRWMINDDHNDDDGLARPSPIPICLATTYTETVLDCVSGSWTKQAQVQWDHRWQKWFEVRAEALSRLSLDVSIRGEPESFGTPQHFPDTAINLSALTISNLSERDSQYIMSSPAMKRFLATQSLSTLQLLTTSGRHNRAFAECFILRNKYKFFEGLPSSWLSPCISDRLRTLSLFAHDYWGWCPKMDFRVLSRGPNGTGGLPNLRTLALGKYVFSHQWQVDWIAQVGSDNGRGGLQELYLDDCPIMWRGRVHGPVDSEGFPQEEFMTNDFVHPDSWNTVTVDVDLRWSPVLEEWREKMQSLKVFRMGSGDWDGASSTHVAMARTASRARVVEGAYMLEKHRNEDTCHVNYDRYSMEDCRKYGQEIIRDGVGISQKRQCMLQYVHFEIALANSPWYKQDFKWDLTNQFEDGHQRYEAARRQDEEALYAFNAAIECRNGHPRQ